MRLVITWQQLQQYPATYIENRKETNMEKMDKFTHPIELSDEELDLVAAGALVAVTTGDITALNNIAVLSAFFKQSA